MACHDGLVPDRLSPLDVSFLYFEEPTTPMHATTATQGRIVPINCTLSFMSVSFLP